MDKENEQSSAKPTYEELLKSHKELLDFWEQFVMMKFPLKIENKEQIIIECLVPINTAQMIAKELKNQ